MDLQNALKELAEAIKDQPKQAVPAQSKSKKPTAKQYVRTQALDWDNVYGHVNLTRNQTKPWSHILNGFPKDIFMDKLDRPNPKKVHLVYNASEHGWDTLNMKNRCKIKGQLLVVIKTDTGAIGGTYINIPMKGWSGTIDHYGGMFNFKKHENGTLEFAPGAASRPNGHGYWSVYDMSYSLIHISDGYVVYPNCNEHYKNFSYMNGEAWLLPVHYGRYNPEEGRKWLFGEMHFRCVEMEIY